MSSSGIPCPVCSNTQSSVVRTGPHQGYIGRRRQCDGCGHRFTTSERIPGSRPLHMEGGGICVGDLVQAVRFAISTPAEPGKIETEEKEKCPNPSTPTLPNTSPNSG